MRFVPAVFLAFLLCACAPAHTKPPPIPADCADAYVMLPGNYIVDLAAGAEVALNPGAHSFPLFCSANDAHNAFVKEMAGREGSPPDWRVFRLDQSFTEIAVPCGYRQWCLGAPALAVEWIEMPGD